MHVFRIVVSSRCFFLCWRLPELLGSAWGRLGEPLGATWASSGHLGCATGHGKITDDKEWFAMVMGFGDLLIFLWFERVF